MGLDLQLIAISNKANFIIEKARQNVHYAIDLNKVYSPEELRLHLKMIQYSPDGTPEEVLKELIEDAEKIVEWYPLKKAEDYTFFSKTRGYETLNYLILKYLIDRGNNKYEEYQKVFYDGINIDYGKQFVKFHYLNKDITSEIFTLLEPINFEDLMSYYDYEKMENEGVYKLAAPDKLKFLAEEYRELKQFYKKAHMLEAFVLVIVY